jgi:hypothetical protein
MAYGPVHHNSRKMRQEAKGNDTFRNQKALFITTVER